MVQVQVVENILSANDRIADQNRERLDQAGVFSINFMASPGAGKTSTILATHALLKDRLRVGMINGDLASTIDADRAAGAGMPSMQINTGGSCHLDAVMLHNALQNFPLDQVDLLIVENVGNLVCPAGFQLGTHLNVLIASIPEGDDKPYKYPPMYRGVNVLLINKIDVLPYFKFNMDYFRKGVEILNPEVVTFPICATSGEGVGAWVDWLADQVKRNRR
ncbi:MAG: hydrogenase nickel incorporation protein HypB [Anaerolinea sp.]|nr:hydrogenase nickel incorporation protein HypB [Anaerolinea sp.]MCC6973684.1 hydrogenase nickel incorporation protein HypB [Anaerolineae bacterium]CAG0974229.1 Hydrogenase maturation factor HypB [Anaerolineae bacterium]